MLFLISSIYIFISLVYIFFFYVFETSYAIFSEQAAPVWRLKLASFGHRFYLTNSWYVSISLRSFVLLLQAKYRCPPRGKRFGGGSPLLWTWPLPASVCPRWRKAVYSYQLHHFFQLRLFLKQCAMVLVSQLEGTLCQRFPSYQSSSLSTYRE